MPVVKRMLILFCLLYPLLPSFAQTDSLPSVRKKRVAFVAAANGIFYTGSFVALNRAWYADYPKTTFHFFNDNAEWNQMDKAGHVWSTLHIARYSTEMWRWSGLDHQLSVILGGISGMAYQTIIEMQDAYSSAWGFSWGDVGANTIGAGAFVLQELTWKEQRLQVKLGYWPSTYPPDLIQRRNQLFGKSTAERLLKDYNSQTYWVSANVASFFPSSRVPKWLNLAAGYSAGGMYGGRTNKWTDKEGTHHDYTFINRARKYYVAPDIDLTKIPVKAKWLKSVFFVLNAVKIPTPALELTNGSIKGVIR